MKKLTLLLFSFLIAGMQLVQAQGVVITGKATDQATSEPLPGVTVLVKGTTVGATSLADGTYRVTIPAGGTALVFSFIGYQTQEVAISGRSVIDVSLKEESLLLDEIVVTGYSVEKKKDIIGSVSVVNTDQMKSTASGNVLNQMQGRVSGLTITSDGSVDGSSKVRIRGFGSFAGSDPLYIIDGTPGSIDRLNPNDIQSVQVLKDAASASVYGARAANGVVIVTTRQGVSGANKLNIDYYYGINYATNEHAIEMCSVEEMGQLAFAQSTGAGRRYGDSNWGDVIYGNGPEPVIPEFIQAFNAGSKLGGGALERLRVSNPTTFASITDLANYSFATNQIVRANVAGTDWFDEAFNPAPVQNLQLSTSGGSTNGNYLFSLGYFDQKSITNPYAYFQRFTLRSNTSFNVKKWLKIGENLQVSYQPGTSGEGSASVYTMEAIAPPWDEMGNPVSSSVPGVVQTGAGSSQIASNWRSRFNGYYTYAIFGNGYVDINPIKDLVIHSSFGMDMNYRRSKSLSMVTYENAENRVPPNSISWSFSDSQAWTFLNQITYGKTLGSHTFKIMLATEANENNSSSIGATRNDLLIETEPDFQILEAATGTQSNSGSLSQSRLWSQFGRVDYSYADKYIFNFTLRRDGSSKFAVANRFGYFPAAAIGWRITSEDFMQSLTWVNDLKLRASYGTIGNQSGLSNENQYTLYTRSTGNSYPITGVNGSYANSYTPSRLGAADARWEKSNTLNIGLDASMFEGATSLTIDWFNKETRDLLVTNQPPYTAPNITQPSINVGTIRNRGIDVTLTQRGKIAGQVEYEVSANFSAYKNLVIKVLDNPLATLSGGGTRMGNATLTQAGYPMSFFYGYIRDGFINTQEELDAYAASVNNTVIPPQIGRWKLKDLNSDGIVNDMDRGFMGSPHPKWQGGVTFSLGYKGFDFNGFVFLNYGNQIFNWNRYNTDFNVFAFNRSKRMLYDSWTPETAATALLPKLDINDAVSNKYPTDYFVEDGSYLRLKQLQLGYTLPASMASRMKIEKLRVYVQAQNLFTLTRFTGLDAGLSTSGADLSMGVSGDPTPTPKQILFGISLGF